MHLKRQKAPNKIPIPRKGKTFVVRPRSHLNDSIPVLIALRDMLKIVQNKREIKKLLNEKIIEINGKRVKDFKQSIKIFNILKANKLYILTISPLRKFIFKETKSEERPCKVIGKKILKKNKIQLNLNDGSNILLGSDKKINIGDTLIIDFSSKIKKHIPLEKGKKAFIILGKYQGNEGKISSIEKNKVLIKIKDKEVLLNKNQIMIIE